MGKQRSQRRRAGFTLVEVMIVVVIMAILAGIVIPQVSVNTAASKDSAAKANLHMLRAQIELYKVQHDGRLPSSGLKELLQATNASGTTTAPAPYGPYAMAIPVNPYNNSATVVDTTGRPPTANVTGAGYLFNPTTGGLWVNNSTTPFAQQ